ncbi:receptor-type tyrosine-protein phosphatase delta-like [Sardina pilchardus]|uniref:receptor-type tyrosine-protein phosphatase delta-like n=1 Tax=Sardina pilchardus TaxID=27697 RepID=UPI002E0E164F
MISSGQRYEVIDFIGGSGSVLRIEPLKKRQDEAVYECVATNSAGQISTSTNLTVLRRDQLPQGFPSIDLGPRLKVVERYGIATMRCAASGTPNPEITWFKDFLPVNTSNSNGCIKQLPSGALQINQSEETDMGIYECVATNSEGTRYSAPANLYMRVRRVPPRFSIRPQNSDIMRGGSVNITCVAVGSPMPYVTWMLGSEDLTPSDDMPLGRNVLELTDVRQSANYTCVAMSSLGTIETGVQITVKWDQLPQGFPSIDLGPQLKVVERSRMATMRCAASGTPDPEITWFKDFLPVNTSNSNGRIKQLPSGALQINQSEETDQGKYECVATNSEGTRYSAPANLYVRVRRFYPRFTVLPQKNSDIMRGGSVNLTCEAVGEPMPYVKWMLGDEDLTPEDDMPIRRNVLELTDVRQSANYTCVAISSLGILETEVQITVK